MEDVLAHGKGVGDAGLKARWRTTARFGPRGPLSLETEIAGEKLDLIHEPLLKLGKLKLKQLLKKILFLLCGAGDTVWKTGKVIDPVVGVRARNDLGVGKNSFCLLKIGGEVRAVPAIVDVELDVVDTSAGGRRKIGIAQKRRGQLVFIYRHREFQVRICGLGGIQGVGYDRSWHGNSRIDLQMLHSVYEIVETHGKQNRIRQAPLAELGSISSRGIRIHLDRQVDPLDVLRARHLSHLSKTKIRR